MLPICTGPGVSRGRGSAPGCTVRADAMLSVRVRRALRRVAVLGRALIAAALMQSRRFVVSEGPAFPPLSLGDALT